jgi:hypothetical protein
MATDTKLQILIDIQSRLAGLQEAVSLTGRLRSEVDRASASGQNFVSGFVGGIAGGAIVGFTSELARVPALMAQSISEGVRFNATLESARIGVAAIIDQFDETGKIRNFDDALRQSGRTIDLLKEKAKQTSATFSELVEGYQANAGPLFQAQISSAREQVDIVVAASQAMAALAIPTNQLNQELRAIFQGDVSRNSRLNQVLRITKEEIDAAAASGRAYELIMAKLASFAEAGARAQDTFNTRLSNFSDITTELKAIGTSELFDQVRESLGELNRYLSRPETAEAAAGWGGEIGAVLEDISKRIQNTKRDAEELMKLWQKIRDTGNNLFSWVPGQDALFGATAGAAAISPFDVASVNHFVAASEKALSSIRENIEAAETEKAIAEARTQIEEHRAELTRRTGDENARVRHEAELQLLLLAEVVANWDEAGRLVGVTAQRVRSLNDELARQTTLLELEAQHFAKTSELMAKLTGDERGELHARLERELKTRTDAYEKAGAVHSDAVRLAQEEVDLLRAIGLSEIEIKETREASAKADKASADAKREQAEAMSRIHDQQSLVTGNSFLGIEEQNRRLVELLREEARAHLAAGDAAKAHLASLEALALTPTGQFTAELNDWVNGLGSAAEQAAGVITGTLNAAIQQVSASLARTIWQTGEWENIWLSLGETATQMLIEMGLQMAAQQIAAMIRNQAATQQQVASGAQIAAANAPAAAATSVATGGTTAVVGMIAAIAAIAAIVAALTAFRKGGYTGDGDPDEPAGVVHKKEFVFDELATSRIGVANLERIRGYANGGRVMSDDDPWIDPHMITLPGAGAIWASGGARFGASGTGSGRSLGRFTRIETTGDQSPRRGPIVTTPTAPGDRIWTRFVPDVSNPHTYSGSGNALVDRGLRPQPNPVANVGGTYMQNWAAGLGAGGAWGLFGAPLGSHTWGSLTSNMGYGSGQTSVATYWGTGSGRPIADIPTAGAVLGGDGSYAGAGGGGGGFQPGSVAAYNFITPGGAGFHDFSSGGGGGITRYLQRQLGFAGGGRLGGPPSFTDNTLAWLATGEHVIPTAEVMKFDRTFGRDFLDHAFDNMSFLIQEPPRFANGGRVANSPGGSGGGGAFGAPNFKVDVFNYTDPDELAEAVANSSANRKVIINTIDGSRMDLGL